MDHRYNENTKQQKLLEENKEKNLGDPGIGDEFFRYNIKSTIHERKN